MGDAMLPLHLEPIQQADLCEKRLWIGNLDHRINEYQLLKLVRAYGNIEKFDMLFHRSGPNAGQPRGFAFVSYKLRRDAITAMNSLNGQLLGNKRISVKFAKQTMFNSLHGIPYHKLSLVWGHVVGVIVWGFYLLFNLQDDHERPKPELGITALTGAKPEMKLSKKTAIQCIEAKLKMMESIKPGDDFEFNKVAANEVPIISLFQNNHHANKSTSSFRRRHPYHKKR